MPDWTFLDCPFVLFVVIIRLAPRQCPFRLGYSRTYTCFHQTPGCGHVRSTQLASFATGLSCVLPPSATAPFQMLHLRLRWLSGRATTGSCWAFLSPQPPSERFNTWASFWPVQCVYSCCPGKMFTDLSADLASLGFHLGLGHLTQHRLQLAGISTNARLTEPRCVLARLSGPISLSQSSASTILHPRSRKGCVLLLHNSYRPPVELPQCSESITLPSTFAGTRFPDAAQLPFKRNRLLSISVVGALNGTSGIDLQVQLSINRVISSVVRSFRSDHCCPCSSASQHQAHAAASMEMRAPHMAPRIS